jgi:hypothetical protein
MGSKVLSFLFKILLFFAGSVLKRLLRQLSQDVRQEAELTLRNLACQARQKTPDWPWDDELVRFCQRAGGFTETFPKDGTKDQPEDPSFDDK